MFILRCCFINKMIACIFRFLRSDCVQRDAVHGPQGEPANRFHVVAGENRWRARQERDIRRNAGKLVTK